MSGIKIQKIGITKLNTDAIVDIANSSLAAGGGGCGARFTYGKPDERSDRQPHKACETAGLIV
ncbi:MAG: hypothetical protein MR607_07445 [Lachnospiraceae bacterium]|nr:hypothetical protein [Lachnospiraceae bacterium]